MILNKEERIMRIRNNTNANVGFNAKPNTKCTISSILIPAGGQLEISDEDWLLGFEEQCIQDILNNGLSITKAAVSPLSLEEIKELIKVGAGVEINTTSKEEAQSIASKLGIPLVKEKVEDEVEDEVED